MPSQQRSITAFYLYGGVREIIPIYPLYAVMFGEHGISPFELSLLFVIWAFVGLVTEVPSGALADRYSRRWLMVIGLMFKSLGYLSWYVWQDFAGFALGFVLWGFGSALRSGAWEALLHDLLTHWDRDGEFSKHYGRIVGLGTLGAMLGEICGGILIVLGYDIVLLVSMLVPLLATLPVIFWIEDAPKTEEAAQRDYLETLRQGLAEAINSRAITYILLAYAFLITTFGIYDEYVSPIFFEKGFSLQMVAFLAVPVYIAQSLGQSLAHHFDFLTLPQLLLAMALSAVPLVFVPFLGGYWIVILISSFFAVFGMASTLFQDHLQEEISGASRATVTSVVALGENIGGILWFLVFGTLAEFFTLSGATLGLAIGVVGFCLLFQLLGRRWGVSRGS